MNPAKPNPDSPDTPLEESAFSGVAPVKSTFLQTCQAELWASQELTQDWMRQPSLDTMYHAWQSPKYDEARRAYNQRECSNTRRMR